MMKSLCATLLTVVLLPLMAAAATMPPLPKGYTGWKKSERKIVTDKNSLFYGIHYIYADKKALLASQGVNRFCASHSRPQIKVLEESLQWEWDPAPCLIGGGFPGG